jgi:FtsP/CotA-like multicopper oxidase with cupredoxin domain
LARDADSLPQGDQFLVLVENHLEAPTSLHWHGLIVPSLEDGVPTITQYPIPPGGVFYYSFPLEQSGTYWYHSHFGLQEQQGLSGPLIIEDPDEPHDYDEDLVVFLSDVAGIPVDRVVPGIRDGSLQVDVANPYPLPDGAPFPIDVPYAGYLINGRPPADPWTQPLRPESRARLRLINGSGSSYFRIAVDGVRLEVIGRRQSGRAGHRRRPRPGNRRTL